MIYTSVTPSRCRIVQLSVSVMLMIGFLAGSVFAQENESNEEICLRQFKVAVDNSLAAKPVADAMIGIGKALLGTPYVANTLEQPGEERLVLNLTGLDCVTFVENTMAFARSMKLGAPTFEAYKQQLQTIRYRGGVVDKYASRLHYFMDWITDNSAKGIVRDVTKEIGGKKFQKTISFMSANRKLYPALKDDDAYGQIMRQESELNKRTFYYIPKERIDVAATKIQNGDIIAICSAVDGLDIVHTGLAIHANGALRLMHASLANGKVEITDRSLTDYVQGNKKQTGIMVIRPQEPSQIP